MDQDALDIRGVIQVSRKGLADPLPGPLSHQPTAPLPLSLRVVPPPFLP